MSRKLRNLLRRAIPAVLATVAFLAAGHRSWLSREVVVFVGLKSSVPQACQIFWTESADGKFSPERSATFFSRPRGAEIRIPLAVARLERLRFDFGTAPGTVRASPVVVGGSETRLLDWRDFTVRHDIGRFEVDAGGAVDVESVGGDPYAVRPEPLDVRGRLRVNAFAFGVFAVLGTLAGLAFAAVPGAARRFAAVPRKGKIRAAAFGSAAFALAAARMAFSARIPPWFGPSGWDDHWFVRAADALIRGNWLGDYNQQTLCKGCFGPMVLAASSMLGIPFPVAENLLYVLGCAFFVFVLSRFVRAHWFHLAVFGAMLFNPLSWSFLSMQRVYRNGMAAWQVPFAFGCLFMAYRAAGRKERGLVPWALVSGFALWALLNTREDGIWIAPFVFVWLVLATLRAWRSGTTRRRKSLRALACLLPVAAVACGNATLCLANWRCYGVAIRNDRDAGNYAKAMRDLYLVEPDPEDEARLSSPEHAGHYHNIYYSTLSRAYAESPTLRGARKGIDGVIDSWARVQGYSGRDLKHDHMLFAIRDGAAREGVYRSLPESEAFFGAVHRELSEAFGAGRLRRRGISFTAMAAPFRPAFVPGILREWRAALDQVAVFREIDTRVEESGATGDVLAVFERTTLRAPLSRDELPAARAAVDRANAVSRAYSSCVPWVLFAALLAWAVLAAVLARRKFRASDALDGWLFATGLLGSVLAHAACIAYMSATTFYATNYCYMAASYQMTLLFAASVAGSWVAGSGKRGEPAERKTE